MGSFLPEWAEPRERSNSSAHELRRSYVMNKELTVHYPEAWEAEMLYEDRISSVASFSSTRRNALPFTVTVTDLYSVFIGNAEEYTVRKVLSEKSDDFWLETVKEAEIARLEASLSAFELVKNVETRVDGKRALLLEYRGRTAAGEKIVEREVLMVEKRVLYSFVFVPGTTTTRIFEKMIEEVELP